MKINPPNYTQVPNVLIDELMKTLTGSQVKVLIAICRKTIGWHKTSDAISYTQMIEITGLGTEACAEALRALEKVQLITVTRRPGCVSMIDINFVGPSESEEVPLRKSKSTSSEIEVTKETHQKKVKESERPASAGTPSLFTAPGTGETDLAGEKKAKKEKHRRIRVISDRFYILYGEAPGRNGAKPRWGVKEQTLVWQDLGRLGDARLMALIESWFKDDLPESVEDWQKKAGLEYVSFHSQIDKLLDLAPVEEKQPQARECVNCHTVTVPVQGVCRACGHTWNVDWQAERAAAKREHHAVGA